MDTMRAWAVTGRPGGRTRIAETDRPRPEPAPDEGLVRGSACGGCRTDLHLSDLQLEPPPPGRVPGHEVVGEVVGLGSAAGRLALGDRVGIAWLRRTCGACRYCRSGRENLCER